VLDLVRANLPILEEMDSHVGGRGLQRHILHKAEAMDYGGGAVVSLIRGDTAGVLRGLDLLEQIGVIPCFDAQDGV
jgi:hypothetical protein